MKIGKRPKVVCFLFLISYFFPWKAFAQEKIGIAELEKFYAEEATVFVASQQAEPLNETPVITSIITAKEIKRMGARTLNDVLLTIPGFSHSQDHNEYFSVERGLYASAQQKILVLRDSHRMNSRSYSEANFGPAISLANVKRIEVMRGPGASLYGDVALSATINIVTKEGKEIDGGEVTVGAGNYGQKKTDVVCGKDFGEMGDIMFFGSIFESEGEEVNWEDPRPTSTVHSGEGTVYGFTDEPAHDVGFRYKIKDLTISTSKRYEHYIEPVSGGSTTGFIYDIDEMSNFEGESPGLASDFLHTEIMYTPKVNDYDYLFKIYYDTFKLSAHLMTVPTTKSHGYLSWEDYDYGTQIQVSKSYSTNWGKGSWLSGTQLDFMQVIDSKYKAGNDTSGYSDYSKIYYIMTGCEKIFGLYGQVKHEFTDHFLANFGLRYDYINRRNYDDGKDLVKNVGQLSPRAALIYSPVEKMSLRLSYGHSFVDAPYWYRYNTFPGYQGIRTLQPEQMDSYQFSISKEISNGLTNQVNFFRNDATNVVFRDVGGVYSNAKARTQGIEYEIERKRENICLRANYTYQGIVEASGYAAEEGKLENVPMHMANGIIDYAPLYNQDTIKWAKNCWLHFSGRYVGSQFGRWGKILTNPNDKVKSAVIFDLGLNLEKLVKENFTLRAHIYNLFDRTYYQGGAVEYPFRQPGRWYLIQATYKW